MKVLWLSNIMLPAYAHVMGLPTTEREGWLSGLYGAFAAQNAETADEKDHITLGILMPVNGKPFGRTIRRAEIDGVTFFPFYEDLNHPEHYDKSLEKVFARVIDSFEPDIVHLFGTEFPHALALVRAFAQPERTLIGLQGICTEIARHYRAELPDQVFEHQTARDAIRRDSLKRQQEKMEIRGVRERSALLLAGHITGRTAFDREFTRRLIPRAIYHPMNETMRTPFYTGRWALEMAKRHSIFVAQGDYPVKGLHFLLRALPQLIRYYPDLHLTVAGNPVFDHKYTGRAGADKAGRLISAKNRLPQDVRNGEYGEYLRRMADHNDLWEHLTLAGVLNAEEMKEAYLSSHIIVCPSFMENSPNSVAEAMLLGVPVIASDAGGIPSMIEDNENGVLFPAGDVKALAQQIHALFSDDALCAKLSGKAYETAAERHDGQKNARVLRTVYREMMS